MWSIVNYLFRIRLHILFVLYSLVSLGLVVTTDPYQHSRWRSTLVEVRGQALSRLNGWRNYWGLKTTNEELLAQLAMVRSQLHQLQSVDSSIYHSTPGIVPLDSLMARQSRTNPADSARDDAASGGLDSVGRMRQPADSLAEYRFIPARVVGNNTAHRHNYLILNRGSAHGIKSRMGVAGPSGAVGIVDQVSDNFCSVITLLHSKARLSAGLAKKDAVGTLFWEGGLISRATLIDIPMHVPVKAGDTIYTSSYSLTFPSGVPVGRVRNYRIPDGESVYRISVDLFTDFRSVQYVHLIDYPKRYERLQLEEKIAQDD